MLERIDYQKTTSSRSEKRFNYLPIINDQSDNAKNTICGTKLQNRRKPPSRTPIQSGLAPYHHPSSIPNRNVREMLLRHQRDRNYKRQGPSMTDKQKDKKRLLRKHGGDLLLGQNNILHGILLALEILRFVVCVGREEEFCQEETAESEGVLIGKHR